MPVTAVSALATALGTLEDVMVYTGQTNPTDGQKVILQRIVNAATVRVEKFCRRPFVARTLTEIKDGKGYDRLYLRARPVISVTSVELLSWDGTVFDTFTGSELVNDLDMGYIRLANGGSFAAGTANWRVVYSASYASIAAVPDDVVLAFLALCAKWWRDHNDRKEDIQNQTADGQTIFYNQDTMPPKIAGILKPYRALVGMEG